jgi:hypothetical protein
MATFKEDVKARMEIMLQWWTKEWSPFANFGALMHCHVSWYQLSMVYSPVSM